jgi:hypothetical protein
VLALLEQPPPARREGIYLQRVRSWCVSTDKEFARKAAEIVGLYLNQSVV